ncbi:MAG: sulfurtransferase [Gammaproteobacteria bacterium]|nr:sulfurtransferase [Gammaproteobacteria bacterium]MDH5731520.1 sulfurtransferase [Gammaproteobacteria bacterium]
MSYRTLISVSDLLAHISDENWLIFDCRFDLSNIDLGEQAYAENHIPGAYYAHLERDLSGEITGQSGRHPLPEVQAITQFLTQCGLNQLSQVVLYDGGGGVMASRLWWMLNWLGHENVAVLDGGFNAWQQASAPLSQEVPLAKSGNFQAHVNSELVLTAEQVSQALDQDYMLIDARAPERYSGEFEPLDKAAGHIPGAVNLPFMGNLSPNGTLQQSADLKTRFDEFLAGQSHSKVIHMCGSGVSACHNILAMAHAGLNCAKLYVGSWSDWASKPERPIATGT